MMKHYIEIFYPYNPDHGDIFENAEYKIIETRNPLHFINESKNNGKIGFRFFDVDESSNPAIIKNRTNISPIYYYGEYLSEEEILKIHEIMPYTIHSTSMIRCYCGYISPFLNDGDTPVKYYQETHTFQKVLQNKSQCKR